MPDNDEIRDLIRQVKEKKQPRDAHGQFRKRTTDDVAQELGMDIRDIRVRALASRDDVEDPEKEVLRLAVSMRYDKITEADKPSEVGRVPKPMPEQERLWQEYREGSRNLYGHALLRFKQNMRAKGWEGS